MTILDGIPLYTTKKEALNWAISNGVRGYHKHVYKNKTGYMGGVNHVEIVAATKDKVRITISKNQVNQTMQPQVQQPIIQTPLPQQTQPVETPETTRPIQPIQPIEPIRRTTQPTRTTTTTTTTTGGGGGGGY